MGHTFYFVCSKTGHGLGKKQFFLQSVLVIKSNFNDPLQILRGLVLCALPFICHGRVFRLFCQSELILGKDRSRAGPKAIFLAICPGDKIQF